MRHGSDSTLKGNNRDMQAEVRRVRENTADRQWKKKGGMRMRFVQKKLPGAFLAMQEVGSNFFVDSRKVEFHKVFTGKNAI